MAGDFEDAADETRIEMCALGYRACANDMISLTHLVNEALPSAIAEYDKTLAEYWHSIGRADGQPWSANTAAAYRTVYFPATYKVALTQGFKNDK